MKKIFAIFSVLFVAFCSLSAADYEHTHNNNKVYFVHGLNDTSSRWSVCRSSYVNYINRGSEVNWDAEWGLSKSADSLNTLINVTDELNKYNKKAVVFGHSAGGLVARKAATLDNNRIRAIITAGTPNYGAGVASAIYSLNIAAAANRAVSVVQTAVCTSELAISSLLGGVGFAFGAGVMAFTSGTLDIAKIVGSGVLLGYQHFEYGKKQAVKDMVPGSTFLNNLPQNNVPTINLYGIETSPKLIRLAGSLSQGDDNAWIPAYNQILNVGYQIKSAHNTAGTVAACVAIFDPFYWVASSLNFTAAGLWDGAVRYLQYDLDNDWNDLIGASHWEIRYQDHWFLWWHWTTSYWIKLYEDSDAFIPNNASMMNGTQNIGIRGVNHMEMNKHPDMKKKLDQILNSAKNTSNEVFNPAN